MLLDVNRYSLREELGIWARNDYSGIPYSDGDTQEEQLLSIIKSTKDRSVSSLELMTHCTDWVTTYHFSSLRSNLLRPLDSIFSSDTKVLEIGAGCGAITRFLGETGANILALEGSLRRATIARARTYDLANVTVVSERFDDFESEEKFDVITLIGVLEYSNLFSNDIDSAVSMLKKVKRKLKSGGKLLIAIENQLGLKYFAGAPEDHVGKVMYGIEGRYTKQDAETYGHKVLQEKLMTVGLTSIQTLLPFPDYKLPVSMITELGAKSNIFDASVFATQSVRADMQLPDKLNFIPERVWPVIFNNKLAIELSNSFLIIASDEVGEFFDKNLLAVHYGGERYVPFRKKTVFKYTTDNKVSINRELINRSPIPQDSIIDFKIKSSDNYVKGVPLSVDFVKIVTSPGWTMDNITNYFHYYLTCLKTELCREGRDFNELSQHTELPPIYLDAIPSNFIIDKDGVPHYFDREWLAKEGLTVGHLIFRATLSLIGNVSSFAIPESGMSITRGEFIHQLFKSLSFSTDEVLLNNYLKLESALYAFSTGDKGAPLTSWYPEQVLPGLYPLLLDKMSRKNLAQLNEMVISLQESKYRAEKLAQERLDEITALHDEIVALHNAKDIAEDFAFERLDKLNAIEAELHKYKSGFLGKLFRLVKVNRD